MMLLSQRKIKNYLLFPRIQITLLCSGLFVSVLSFAILWLKIADTFKYLENIGKQLQFRADSGYFKLLNSQQDLIFKNILVVGIIGAIISGIILLILSHKIVGPIYRLHKFFQEYDLAIEKGEAIPELKFRRGDFFSELSHSVNRSLKKSRN
jgi:hypothetical protein